MTTAPDVALDTPALPPSRWGTWALGLVAGVWAVALWFAFGPALGLALPQHPAPWLDGLWTGLLAVLGLAIIGLVQRGRNKRHAALALLAALLTPLAFILFGFLTINAVPLGLD